jgi:pseudouridine-5'-phosphate glycosidase
VFSYIYLDNQNHSEYRQTFGLPVVGYGKKNSLWITFWQIFSSMKSTLNRRNHRKAKFS